MASSLPLKRVTCTLWFFRAAAVRKQLADAGGLVGYTLLVSPLARHYWTLSVWTDRAALQEFMCAPPHVDVMGSPRPIVGPAKFVKWEISESGAPVGAALGAQGGDPTLALRAPIGPTPCVP